MSFIENFLKKDAKEVTKEDIEAFISRKIEESVNLDYKDIRAFHDFDELSKDVSAFANSEGGLLILGINEERIRKGSKNLRILPKEVTWGEETFSKEQLEDNLTAKIHPCINGLRIIPVREGNSSKRVIFLIDIPKSDNPPHMASDNKYYKRLNFKKQPMEHYEIANLFIIKYAMKDKLIEKIYEPLSSVLEKHAKKLKDFICPSENDVEDILSRTYFKMQMPFELLEGLDYYIDVIRIFREKELHSRRIIADALNKYVIQCLEVTPPQDTEFRPNYSVFRKKSQEYRDQSVIIESLLKEKDFKTFLSSFYNRDELCIIRVDYSINQTKYIKDFSINEFDNLIWNKCLTEASKNTEIVKMKQLANSLYDKAWELIENITTN